MKLDNSLLYSNHHLWVRKISEFEYEAGITDYAQDLLGDIVFVEFPKLGLELESGLPCGLVESVKTGSDLHAPLSGKVTELNRDLESYPERINDAPYKTWIFKFEANKLNELEGLLNASEYGALIEE
jgi:glycine cleavage system H protein